MDVLALSRFIKNEAKLLGFEYCGIARAEFLEDDARSLEAYLNKNYNGKMAYLANHFDLRTDPRKLVPGAKSVISLIYNYYPEQQQEKSIPQIAKYAYSADYHEIIRPLLRQLLAAIQSQVGQIEGRGFVDSAPVLEKAWAKKSGLGWVGKNALLLTRNLGSFFFIAELIVDIELAYDAPFAKDYCGTCTRCIDACPTGALVAPQIINGSQCISYLTIELKDELIPKSYEDKMENWMFGCDICQDVCPWNRFAVPQDKPALQANPNIFEFDLKVWLALEEEQFKTLFKQAPMKRAKYKGIMRNVQFLSANIQEKNKD